MVSFDKRLTSDEEREKYLDCNRLRMELRNLYPIDKKNVVTFGPWSLVTRLLCAQFHSIPFTFVEMVYN